VWRQHGSLENCVRQAVESETGETNRPQRKDLIRSPQSENLRAFQANPGRRPGIARHGRAAIERAADFTGGNGGNRGKRLSRLITRDKRGFGSQTNPFHQDFTGGNGGKGFSC